MKPKPKAEELARRVNNFVYSDRRDDFTRSAILRDIEVLQKVDPATGLTFRGIMASLDHDEREVRGCYEKALRLEPNNGWITFNFSTALHNLGYISEAKDLAQKVHDADQSDLLVLDTLIARTMAAARARETVSLLERRALLKPKTEHSQTEWIHEIGAFFARHSLGDDDVAALLNLSLGVLHGAGCYMESRDYQIRQDEDSEWFSAMFGVALSVEKVLELNTRLADAQAASNFPVEVLERVNFMFIPAGP